MSVFVALLVLPFALVPAQQPRDAPADARARRSNTIRELTGGAEREWVFTRFESALGSEGRCRSGDSYVFRTNGTAVREYCDPATKRLVRSTHRWTLSFPSALDAVLAIDGDPYLVLFSAAPAPSRIRLMTLRNKPRVRTERTQDRIYRYEPE